MDYPQNIFSAVRQERNDFIENEIEIVPGYTFNQYELVKKAHLYYNSRYAGGNYEEVNGVLLKKVFYNISKWRCDIATKMIDLDVKDFLLVANEPKWDMPTFFLGKELKAWLKKNKMGKLLNEITRKLPVYGSVVLRKTEDGARLVDLRHLFNDQTVDSLENARYINIKHLMSPTEVREKSDVWNKVDFVIDRLASHVPEVSYSEQDNRSHNSMRQSKGTPLIEVWESYGERPRHYLENRDLEDGENIEWVKSRFILAGIDDFDRNDRGEITENGIVLFSEEVDELPFKEVHYNRTEGRWLGIGVIEDTFEAQTRINAIKNQEARAMEISSMIIFQTRDKLIQHNALTDIDNGDIIKVISELQRVPVEQRDFNAMRASAQDYEVLGDRQTFSHDLVRGEAPPASTTATAVVNQVQQAVSIFDYKRENLGLFLNEFIQDLVMPQLEKELSLEHVFRVTGSVDEMEKIWEKIKVQRFNDSIFDFILKNKRLPLPTEAELLDQSILEDIKKNGKEIWFKFKKDYFKGIDFYTDLVITGENKNVLGQLQNVQLIMGLLAQNPALLQNPVLRKVMFKLMTLTGMSVSELELIDTADASEGALPPPANQTSVNRTSPTPNRNTVVPVT